MRAGLLILMLGTVWLPVKTAAEPPDAPASAADFEERDVQFTQAAPYSDEPNIARHFGYRVGMPDYCLTNESFRLLIPRSYPTRGSWGLLAWISANDEPIIPSDWK